MSALPTAEAIAAAPTPGATDAAGAIAAQAAPFVGSAAFWLMLALAAALIALACALAIGGRRKRKQAPAIPPTDWVAPTQPSHSPPVVVSKLHEIGKRRRQEDSLSISPEEIFMTHGLLAVLSDGMGGLSDGDRVSGTVVTSAMNAFLQSRGEDGARALCGILAKVVSDVKATLDPSQYGKAGATVIMGLIRENAFHYLSVGDSIICVFRQGKLLRLNRAHVYLNEQYLRAVNGEIALSECADSRKGASLVSFLGMETLARVDLPAEPVDIQPGDRFILMSDGVYNALTKQELCDALSGAPEDIADALRRKIEEKDYAGQDNYTAIVISC